MAAAAGGTVVVACKLPHGLVLRLFKMEEFQEPVMGGGTRTVPRAVEASSQRVVLKGAATRADKAPGHLIVSGYGITRDVPADFFAKWLEQNKDNELVVNNLVFSMTKEADAMDRSREQEKIKSGLEPIDPNNLPRGIRPGNEDIRKGA